MPHAKKKSARKKFISNKKLGLERTTYELRKTFINKSDVKIEKKTVNNKVKLPHVNKNHYRESEFGSDTVFFGVTKITTPI